MQDPLSVAEELIELTTTLATERRLEALLGAVVSAARRLALAEGGRILVLDRTGRHLHGLVGQNEFAPEAAALPEEIAVHAGGNAYNLRDANVFSAVTGKIVNLADVYDYTGFDFAALLEPGQREPCPAQLPVQQVAPELSATRKRSPVSACWARSSCPTAAAHRCR